MARTVIVVFYPSVEAAARRWRSDERSRRRFWDPKELQSFLESRNLGCVVLLTADGGRVLGSIEDAIQYLCGEKTKPEVVKCIGCGWIYHYHRGEEHLLPEICTRWVAKSVCQTCGHKGKVSEKICPICGGYTRITTEHCGTRIR